MHIEYRYNYVYIYIYHYRHIIIYIYMYSMCLGHVIHVFHHLLLRRRSGASRLKAAMLAMPARNFWISMSWPPLCRRGFPLAKN